MKASALNALTLGRHVVHAPSRPTVLLGYLQEQPDGWLLPIPTRAGATHMHVLTEDGIEVAPIGSDPGGVRHVVVGEIHTLYVAP